MQSTGMMVFWFVVIVALIPLTLFALKRSGLAKRALGSSDKMLKVISQLSVGPTQRVVTVELGAADQRTWLVLGVTPQSVTVLHTLQPSEDSQVQAQGDPESSTFPVLLRRSSDMLDLPKN
ncbi:MAG: flagellar biosynthetic protein FliO [Burkholderiales bacterium]|nr:flagellar biosynthetic protein FliO [Burkholderiales bacterium]